MGMPKYRPRESKHKNINDRLYEGFKIWTQYYRANPHRFATEYLGMGLFLFQSILIYMMDISDIFLIVASRGLGKSYLIAVYCCVRAILYPNSKIIIASATKGQSRLLISQKIDKELKAKYPNLAREIEDIKTSANESVVIFKNGSTIEAVASNDNSRGYRGNILIIDEYRMVSPDVLNKVLKPFLNVLRNPKYTSKKEYANYPKEENKEIYMSSAWLKAHWSWEKFNSVVKDMCKGKKYFACDFDYRLAINHGLLSQERAENMRNEEDMDEITWLMEMEGIFYGENSNSLFKFADINPSRNLVKPFYPPTAVEYIENRDKKKKKQQMPKLDDEVRIMGVDVALMAGNSNDNTIITLMRLIPAGSEYIRQVVYIESINGGHSEDQAVRIKQLFYDFNCDKICLDCAGVGMSVYDQLVRPTYDKERDIEYPPFTAYNDEKMSIRASKSALPVIYSIKATGLKFNHDLATGLRSALSEGKMKLLINDIEGRDFLLESRLFANKSQEEQARLLKPYVQTTIMVNETVNLLFEVKNGFIRVYETGSNRKDRFSSWAYANYLARILEKERLETQYNRNVNKRVINLW